MKKAASWCNRRRPVNKPMNELLLKEYLMIPLPLSLALLAVLAVVVVACTVVMVRGTFRAVAELDAQDTAAGMEVTR